MKKLICWLLILAMMLTAAGCKKNTEPETIATETTTEATEPEMMEVPYETEGDSRPYLGVALEFQSELAEADPEAVAIRKAVEFFETTTGAVVNVHWQDGTMDVTQMDIFEVTGALLASDYLDYAMDLTEMAKAADYESWSFAAIRQQVVNRCGYLAGIASVPYLTALYYDADAMESCGITEMPSSWMDFLILCKDLVQKGWVPLTMDADFAYMATELHMEHALGREGLKTLMANGWAENEEAIFVAEQMGTMLASGYLAGGTPAVYPEGFVRLAGSSAVMMASSDRLCKQMEQDGKMEVRWGVFPWPGDGNGTGTAVDEQVLAINKNTENAQAAFDFVQLLASGEFDQLRADLRRGIPADPNNESVIVGAVETLKKASSESFGLLDTDHNEIYAQLWQGTYATGDRFLKAMGQRVASGGEV